MGRFEYREDLVPADCAVEVWGDSLDDLFATAARAVCEVMADPASLGSELTREVCLEAESPDLLLVDFLSELLYLKDRDRALFARAEVRIAGGESGPPGPWRLAATLRGGVVDPERTRRGTDVKAITLHQLVVERDERGWHGRFVVDL